MNIEEKKKRSAIKIEQYEKLVENGRKKIELKERESNNNNKVSSLSNDIDNTKKQIIQEAGKFLETYLMPHLKDKICLQLKQSFKGLIKPIRIEIYSQPKWRQTKHSGVNGKSKISPSAAYRKAVEEKPLTEFEEQFVKVHEQKGYHNEDIEAVIDYYLDLTESEKTHIISKTPKGSDYQKALIDEAYNNMLRIIKSLNDVDIPALLADFRFLKQILTKVADIALEEHEQRKRNKEITGQ
jgi:hypothetical protein